MKIKNLGLHLGLHIACGLLWMTAAPSAWSAAPAVVLATLNIQPDDSKGNDARSFVLMDVGADKVWHFPLSSIAGGPVLGQPMHAALSPDKKNVYITVGGNKDLPLRLLTLSVD